MTDSNLYKGNFDMQRSDQLSFNLSRDAYTSAGVYSEEGSLLRTLWSGKHLKRGTNQFPVPWDGKDDFGNQIADGNYQIIIQDNNASVAWKGVIGNTSRAVTGNTVHLSYDFIQGIGISGSRLYYAGGYSELSSSQAAFDLNDIQVKIPVGKERTTGQTSLFVCSDGSNVYWCGTDTTPGGRSFVYATKCSDNSIFNFSSGTQLRVPNGSVFLSQICIMAGANHTPTGQAVQRSGTYLFVCRAALNRVYVYNKTTGAIVQTLTYTSPGAIKVDTDDSKIWLAHSPSGSPVIEKFTINTNGTLTTAGIQIRGFGEAGDFAVNNSIVAVCDKAIASQQVKAFDKVTGAARWTLGQAGGYISTPDVSNDRFYWKDSNYIYPCSIEFAPDGSFWLLDYGNNRLMHWNADRTFTGESVGYVGRFYSLTTDLNDNTKLFLGWKEYLIDNTKPVGSCWKLIRNWAASAPITNLSRVVTFSNKRRYVILHTGNNYKLYWFSATGVVFTGKVMGSNQCYLTEDGSYVTFSYTSKPIKCTVTKFSLTGYDINNHPVWDNGAFAAATGIITNNDTLPTNIVRNQGYKTKSGKVFFFDTYPIVNNLNQVQQSGAHQGYHLGWVNAGATEWAGQTSRATYTNYRGVMPEDGRFDVGNGVNYNAGSCLLLIDNTIIWGYHGEFWKQTQTNAWNQYSDIGLFVQHFGYAQSRQVTLGTDNVAPAGMAGNSFAAALIKFGSIKRLFHNDESFHGGAHVWDIIGSEDINTQTILFKLQTSKLRVAVNQPATGIDLLRDVPFNTTIPNNQFGFVRNVPDDAGRVADTSTIQYDPVNSFRCFFNSSSPFVVSKLMGNNLTGLTNWKLDLGINLSYGFRGNYDETDGNQKTSNKLYFEILDKDGKVIIRIQKAISFYVAPTYIRAVVNGITTASYLQGTIPVNPVSNMILKYANGVLSVQTDGGRVYTLTAVDGTATPNSLSVMRFNGINDGLGNAIAMKEYHIQRSVLFYNY